MKSIDFSSLMDVWCAILIEGNRRGVLAGLDGNNEPMPPLKYRGGEGTPTKNRKRPDFGTNAHEPTGFGPYATGLNDNLPSWVYRQLDGPRLAPRFEESRVISNLQSEVRYEPSAGDWWAVAAWHDVVSVKGVPFLPYHFEGEGLNPQYDLRPVRPEDVTMAENELDAFMMLWCNERF